MTFLRRAILLILILPAAPFFVFAQEESAPPAEPSIEENAPATELNMDELRKRIYGEAPQEILGFSLGDAGVSLLLTGSWKGTLQGNPGFFISPVGTGFADPQEPIFAQEADITLSLWINDRWFVEANFLDDSSQNTYRAGYQGKAGEFLQYAGIGNTGLDFPSFPYLDLGGDSPSSFGFYSRFGAQGLGIHALVRYDAASREERVFSGGRERTFSYLQLADSVRGISFVLPDTDIDSEITVYIEDEKGTIRDSSGRRWRLALSTEYGAGKTQGLLELTVRPSGMVAVAYSKGGDSQPWNSSMGNYGTAGFLNTVQQWFGSDIDLENYPQSGNGPSARPGEVTFGNIHALVIREPGTFSPFERQSRYDAPSSMSEKAALVRLSSGEEIGGFELVQLDDINAAQAEIPLFTAAISQRNIYELIRSGGYSRRDPESSWPLAEMYPEIYLPGAAGFSGDIALRFTNYNSSGGYFIGTDAVAGSVQVWRSGIQDNNFTYNSSSGEVKINGPVGQNEVIRITYLKKTDETRIGSIAAGLGAIYRKGASPFSAQAAVGVRWNLTEDAYTEEDQTSVGTVGISAKTAWDYDYLKAHIAAGFTFEQTDTTGLYRAAGMEGNETVVSLPYELSFISHPPSSAPALTYNNRADLVYRNYFDNSALGSNLMTIEWNASVISGINRPYPVKDSQLGDAQVLTAEFSLGANEWTGFQVPVNNYSGLLSRAGEIEIPFRFYDFNFNVTPSDFELIVQIGSLSGEDFAFTENSSLILEGELFTKTGGVFDTSARIAKFTLTEQDRLKLGNAKYLRIVARNTGGTDISGRVMIAPPIVRGAAFRPVILDNDTIKESSFFSSQNIVTAVETIETGAALSSAYGEIIRRLHPSDDSTQNTQRVMKIDWENMQQGVSAGVDGRVGELPLDNYRELSFFVKGPQPAINGQPAIDGSLSFIVASGPDSISGSRLQAQIPLNAFGAGQWSKVTIRYQGDGTGVFVNGTRVDDVRYRPLSRQINNSEPRTSYIAILVNPTDSSSSLGDGSISIDEIILEDSLLVYRVNAGAAIKYSRPGTLISIGNVPVLADLSVSTAVESEIRAGSEESDSQVYGSVVNRTAAEFSLLGVNISGNFAFTAAQDEFLWSADHAISKKIGPFSVSEKFSASPYEKDARHNVNMSFLSDFYAKFDADALYDLSKLRQKWNLGIGYTPPNELIPAVAFTTEAAWTRSGQIEEDENYGEIWVRSWEPLIPDTGSGADLRKTTAQIVITQRTKPVGAVLTLDGSVNFSGANSLTRSESSLFLDVPLVLGKTTVNFRSGRSFKKHLYFYGDDALADGSKFFESINDSLPTWGVFPFYSLFAPELQDAMNRGVNDSPSADLALYTSFNDHFSTAVSLPPVYNLLSFFVPSKFSFRIERVLEQKLDTAADILNIGGSLNFSAINMFGRLGYSPIFKFYQSDEFTHSATAAVIIPKNENVSWKVQSILGAGFKGFSGAVLNFVNTLSLNSGGLYSDLYWTESFVLDWTVPTKKSILSIFYNWVAAAAAKQGSWLTLSALLNSNYEQLRRESLELAFDKTTDYLRWRISAGHEEIIRIQGKLEFTTFLKLRCTEDLKTEIMIFDALIGTSLRINF